MNGVVNLLDKRRAIGGCNRKLHLHLHDWLQRLSPQDNRPTIRGNGEGFGSIQKHRAASMRRPCDRCLRNIQKAARPNGNIAVRFRIKTDTIGGGQPNAKGLEHELGIGSIQWAVGGAVVIDE